MTPTAVRQLFAIAFHSALFAICVPAAEAQPPRADSLEQWIRRAYSLGTPESREVWRQLGWSGGGFGFRSFAARSDSGGSSFDESIAQFAASMEYYRIRLDEVHTRVDGDVGLAWGVHTEEFKVRGRPAESVRVRFTNTLRWEGSGWKNLLYHRDAQPFDENGRYVRPPAPRSPG